MCNGISEPQARQLYQKLSEQNKRVHAQNAKEKI